MNYSYNKLISPSQLTSEIQASAITIALDYINSTESSCEIVFKATLSSGEEDTLTALVTAHIPQNASQPVQEVAIVSDSSLPKDLNGNLMTTNRPRSGSSKNIVLPPLGDPCTWVQNAIQVVDEVASPDMAYTEYTLDAGLSVNAGYSGKIIDTEHGRQFGERNLLSPGVPAFSATYKVVVKKNDVVVTTGFTVDYENRKVVFDDPLLETDEIKVSYWYPTSYNYTITSIPGKQLRMMYVEVQFPENVWLSGKRRIYFDTYAGETLVKSTCYQSLEDFIDESNNEGFAVIPPANGFTKSKHVYIWRYPTTRDLLHSQNYHVIIRIEDVAEGNSPYKPLIGDDGMGNEIKLERATATFYNISENEPS